MSMKSLRVLVLICSTRPNALGPAVGAWLTSTLTPSARALGVELAPVALGDLQLPFLDEEEHPARGVYQHEHTRQWSEAVAAADGFIVVTPEYNYGMPATLKNALDYLGGEWAWKPVGFVSYGNTSAGTRAVQHAKQTTSTLRLVSLGSTVALRIADAQQQGGFRPADHHARAAVDMLEELARVGHALAPLRAHDQATPGPLPGSYVKRLHLDDGPHVTVLQRCCWVDEAIANNTLELPALHETPAQVRQWLADWHATGLWHAGRLLGMVRTVRHGSALRIGRLAVTPDLRGRGLGRWLLRIAETRSQGCDHILLTTGADSSRNLAFYRKQGYAPLPATNNGEISLRKDLAS
ncbi:bifunctional NAD(P)H-dependent oxidoreductase/GNAT family N-acetyltransferase [Streptomyces atriruber]|uniref:bifunctional NAD(P)H-dependent oxidoreductase/GNAT family N-acetyltransferase n=1 Tax=Streptomyces atriruber TaxID=545121 RepID=UPI0006E14B9A|nr:bifunctional NAD(P)H-dependent oxidoreductase/GNAT family N-acetyltransferase [Streptomyces atriruber]